MSKGVKKTSNDKLAERIEKAVEILQKEKKYTCLGHIGSGSFGQVFRMIEPLNKSELAVKIVPYEMVSKAESELWENLSHPNLVPLIGVHKLKIQKTFVFLMPVYPTTLFDSIQDLTPCKGAYNIVKSWLKDVLQGLDYLHCNGACHLDLKPDNVLISDQNSALLCDFTFLRDCKTPLYKHDIGLPSIYRPPEVLLSKERKYLDGTSIDMWAFGCLLMELLSCFTLTNACMDGREQMYTTVLSLLEEYSLLRPIMINIFKGDDLCETDVKLALRFMKEFLTFEASHRLPARRALTHEFFHKDIDSIHNNVDAKHTPLTNSTASTLRSEHLSVNEAVILENIDAEKTQTPKILSETDRKQVNDSKMSEIGIHKSTDRQSMPGTGPEMISLISDTLPLKSINLENECGVKPTEIDESNKEQSVTSIEDNTRTDMEKKNDLILLKIIELREEVKYLRIKLENIEKSLENLMKRNSVDKNTKSTGKLENRRNEINGESMVDRPINSVRKIPDEVVIVHKEHTKVKKEKKKGRALNWMRTACRRVFGLFKKRGSN
nr:cyclin-dependent kinase-like 1 [Parasteatoda tepidariorum]